jgi:hypothetical protein
MMVIALLFWTVAVGRQTRELWCGAFIIVASTLPVYGYFFVRQDLLSARYVYFAGFGWGVILAALFGAVVRAPQWLGLATVSLALFMAMSLDINLRPWRVAGDVVNVMTAAIAENDSPQDRLADWTTRNDVRLSLRGSVPYEYRGVGIFINGYDGFVRHVRRSSGR